MNKYLVKVAFAPGKAFTAAKNVVKENKEAFKWGAALSTAGAARGATAKVYDNRGNLRSQTKNEKIRSGIGGGLLGAALGAHIGSGLAQGKRSYNSYKNSGRSSSHGPGSGRTVKDIHADLKMPSGGFKTKAEATAHFRRTASATHPDKHPQNREAANAAMAKVNAAWSEFKKHPDGFEKLARVKILKKVVELYKKNPGAMIGGSLGAADGATSSTKSKKESHLKYRLRQVRNIGVGAGVGAAIGVGAEKLIKSVA